jgi:hypothetical protein
MAKITFHSMLAKGRTPADHAPARTHFSQIAGNNGETKGLFHWVETPGAKADQDSAVSVLADALRNAFDVLARGASGKLDPTEGKGVQSAFAAEVWQLFGSLTMKGKEAMLTGYAAEHNQAGRQVALKRVFVLREELDRLRATMNFVRTQLADQIDPEERKNVNVMVDVLQVAAGGTVAGQVFSKDTRLADFVTDLPLRTDALQITARQLAAFTEPQFKDWLAKLRDAEGIAERLLREKDSWSAIRRKGKVDEVGFFLLSQLP